MFSPLESKYETDGWTFKTNRCHILNSKCTSSLVCSKTRAALDPSLVSANKSIGTPKKTLEEYIERKNRIYNERNLCLFCKYDLILSMAHLPDMTYASNYLKLHHHKSKLSIEFNALDALAPVVIKSYGLPVGLKVSASEAWLRARTNCEYTKNVCNADFDWTFSTDYSGTYHLEGYCQDLREDMPPFKDMIDSTTPERIDMDKLKIRKQINFFDEVELFEDELADHGVAQCTVKIRVHNDSFYLLCRFFLRVDRVFVRYFDTRIYHEFGKEYLLRERSQHESTVSDLNLPEDSKQALLIKPQELFEYVPLKQKHIDKIILSESVEKSF